MGRPDATSSKSRLSRREMEVAGLVAEGLTNREIAARLFLSERTVDGHLEHVREKLNVTTRAQVAAWVVRQQEAPPAQAAPSAGRSIRPFSVRRSWLWTAAVVLVAVEAVAAIAVAQPPQPTITTVAGSQAPARNLPVGDFAGDGGRATAALLSLPSDVAVTGDGTIYFADYRNQRIRQVLGGTIKTVAGGGQESLTEGRIATSVNIQHASNVAVDAAGQPYFLTNHSGVVEVWRLEQDYSLTRIVTIGPSQVDFSAFAPPTVGGLAIGPHGTIYVSDRSANVVYRYTPGDPGPIPVAGNGRAGFSGDERGPATDASLWSPAGVAVDSAGNVYIADSVNNRIRRVDTSGFMTTVAGSGKYYGETGDGGDARRARLHSPYGVAVARDGTVYVADTGNNRIREVSPAGIITTLAGTGLAGFAGDGREAPGARLAAPEGISLDGKGDLFLADTLNLRIREIGGLPG